MSTSFFEMLLNLKDEKQREKLIAEQAALIEQASEREKPSRRMHRSSVSRSIIGVGEFRKRSDDSARICEIFESIVVGRGTLR